MNAIIKPQPCPCCEEKDQQIALLQSAFSNEVSGLMDTIAQQKHTIATQEKIIEYGQVRTADLMERGRRFSADLPAHAEEYRAHNDRRKFRGAWEAQKRAEAALTVEVAK